jgi:hypothetical protein
MPSDAKRLKGTHIVCLGVRVQKTFRYEGVGMTEVVRLTIGCKLIIGYVCLRRRSVMNMLMVRVRNSSKV